MLKEGGQTASTPIHHSEHSREQKSVEWMLKKSLKAFKLFQHRFDIVSTLFNTFQRG